MKKCSICNNQLDESQFSKNKSKSDGLNNYCKSCHKIYRKSHYLENKKKVLLQVKIWNGNNPKKHKNNIIKSGRIVTSKCKNCNETVFITKSDKLEKNIRCCSRKCSNEYRFGDNGINYIYKQAKRNAKVRNKEFNITKEYITNIWIAQDKRCAITNIPLKIYDQREKKSIKDAASLDRIDSSKGYIEGNVQWVSLGINYMKKNYSDNELYELLDIIVANYKTQE